jgi:peptide deformylase
MPVVPLIIAPDPIFKMKAEPVTIIDDSIRALAQDILDTMYQEHGIGIAAPMIGILKQVIAIDLQHEDSKNPIVMINPKITSFSAETQVNNEGSLSFPGIAADITRPKTITVEYLDLQGKKQTMEESGLMSACIQHECDYLIGKVFLDYLSPIKRDMLIRRMQKVKKHGYVPHQHTDACRH